MGKLVFGVLVLAAACVRTSTVTCGDLTCEVGSVCSPGGGACTTQAQIDACVFADTPATTCTAPEGRAGVCRDGYCQEIRCGDLRVDPGEMCDDGNAAAADGCSPDCLSDETCGNGVLDRGFEECDDTNLASHDGCSMTCKVESPIWRQVIDTSFPVRESHAMVYDVARSRVVLFGGRVTDGVMSNDTWEFDGARWTLRTPLVSPPARERASLAYDTVRNRTVLFGGSNGIPLADTWEWDGTNWLEISPTTSPSARYSAAVGFHPGRAAVVLYGGAGDTVTDDTWEYNGTTWSLQAGAGTAGKSAAQPMSYNPAIGGLVLFGAGFTAKTWRYNGTWTEQVVSGPPPRWRQNFGTAYDTNTNATVVIGGAGGECGLASRCSDAFEIREASNQPGTFLWINTGAPYAPANGDVAYDLARNQLVVMGGFLAGTIEAQSATWLRSAGDQWSKLEVPPARAECLLAYLPALGGTVLFSGASGASSPLTFTDGWLFHDDVWTPLAPNTPPTSPRGMVLDRGRNKLVVLDAQSKTWEFDGTSWSMITTASAPIARESFGMVYDEARAAVVLFGGRDLSKVLLADTWTYNGTNWTQLATTGAPPARWKFAMSYDGKRDVIVVFGGLAPGPDDATWELSGTTWTQNMTAGPSARAATPMAFDRRRQSSILFGGATTTSTTSSETWEYVDGAWRSAATLAPPARATHCSAYDETLEKTVVFGGVAPNGTLRSDTWLFGYE